MIEAMFAIFTAALGVAVVVSDARDARDEPEPDIWFDRERAALEVGPGDELDDPARVLFGPFDQAACLRVYEEISAL